MTTQELLPPSERIEIEGSNGITLRQFAPKDAQAIFELIDHNRPHLSQNHNGERDDTADKYRTVEDVLDSILHPKTPGRLRFGIWDGDVMVGSSNLNPIDEIGRVAETGSWIGKRYTGHNYAARAREVLIDLAFNQLGYKLLTSEVAVGNEASRKSVEKSGYKFIRIIQLPDKKGAMHNFWHYELTPTDINRLTT